MSSPESEVLIDLTDAEFQALAELIERHFGIHLTDRKRALVRGRLYKSLRSRGLSNYGQFLDLVRHDTTGEILVELVDRISTNHTYFFRESEHFSFLANVALPEAALHELHREIRIWCAGCATGEEAYTLAMTAREWMLKNNKSFSVRILATDISLTALETAIEARYSDERVRHVPQTWRSQFLVPLGPDQWTVKPELKEMILFKRLNFMDGQFPFRQKFHAIFCRNVMIYFDRATKDALVQRFAGVLLPNHYLFIGHSESLGRETPDFSYVRPSVYRRRL